MHANNYSNFLPNIVVTSVGILEQPIGARNRVRVGLKYTPARLRRLAGRYDNTVPIVPVDCPKIQAQEAFIIIEGWHYTAFCSA